MNTEGNEAYLVETPNYISEEVRRELGAKVLPPESIVFPKVGGAIATNKKRRIKVPSCVDNNVMGLVPETGKVSSNFLAWWMHGIDIYEFSNKANPPSITQGTVKDWPIAIPPLEEQQRIVAVLDEAFEGLARARVHAEANLQNAQELFAGTISAEFSKIDSFKKRRVGDVAEHSLGKMLDKNKNKGTLRPYLRNLNVRWFTVDTSDLLEMRITDAEVERYTVRKGDLLICEGGYPGRSSIWEQDEEIFFQKALHRVRFEDEAYSRLLMYYLFMSHKSGALQEHCSGAGIQHFTGKSLAKFEMPFPTLDVAEKMIGTIEEMQRSSAELEGHFQRKLEDLDDLRQSLLQKAFAGELT